MGLLTFKGGLHPYDGKELSRTNQLLNIYHRESWYTL